MAKPKPTEKMVGVSFQLPVSMKDKWKSYAESLGFPLARIIKETMNNKIDGLERKPSSQKFAQLLESLFNEVSEVEWFSV